MKNFANVLTFLSLVTLIGCSEIPENTSKSIPVVMAENRSLNTPNSIIRPAFNNFDIEKESFIVNPSKGDTLFMSTGSFITIPKDCFVDSNGDLITTDVRVTYREFSTPLDFFISGIPMDYDSLGESYTFESAGMCEVLAYSGNEPVFVNPENTPNVYLTTNNTERNFNLYRLDTNQAGWEIKESSTVIDANEKRKEELILSSAQEENEMPKKPIEPTKPTEDRYTFTIDIDRYSTPELQVYNNLKFEIHEDDKSYNPKDFEELWENVELKKGSEEGTYIVTFSNYKRSVSYLTRPVYGGEDYDKAMEIYKSEKKKYSNLREEQKSKEEKQLKAMELGNEKIIAQNKMIFAQNKEIEKLNQLIDARNAEIEAQNRISEQKKIEYQKLLKESQNRADIYRSFKINNFGIWNCDRPILKSGVTIYAKFEDKKGNELDLNQVTLVYKEINGVISFYGKELTVIPDSGAMLWAVRNETFYYLTYQDFQKLELGSHSRKFTFKLKAADMEITSKAEINNLLGI